MIEVRAEWQNGMIVLVQVVDIDRALALHHVVEDVRRGSWLRQINDGEQIVRPVLEGYIGRIDRLVDRESVGARNVQRRVERLT